ncbi:hypothetical protein [Kiloniella sp. b19]|uniref:hypothetical protein n=1 Tax=Kiloniella sp. GXU_MW_B19 TaxID=3141326 RepID=UPI0031D974BD
MRNPVLIRLVYIFFWLIFIPFILLLNLFEARKGEIRHEEGGSDPRKTIAKRHQPRHFP